MDQVRSHVGWRILRQPPQALVADRNDTPIIFIAGHGDVPMTVRAMKAGAVEFLTKPLVCDVLMSAIRNAPSPGLTAH